MASKNGKKKTERGLNVKVKQDSDKAKSGNLHVNTYQKKSKAKVNKSANTKNTSTKNSKTTKKTTDKKADTKTNVKANIKAATKKPASFSETPKDNKGVAKTLKTDKKVIQEKNTEKKPEPKVPSIRENEDTQDKFETLEISGAFEGESVSKVILRDVAKDDLKEAATGEKSKEVKLKEAAVEAKPEETKPEKAKSEVPQPKLTAQEIKDREIKKAISTATKLPTSTNQTRKRLPEFGWQRVVLALCCAATAVFAIAYFVNLNSSNISLKVAAMQSGIEATYPSYVPRGYDLSDITSSSGKVTINFKSEEGSFSLTEESSNWDSNALLNNYIKDEHGEDYTMVREQGLTLYMGNNWEAWVNGGVLYKLKVTAGSLTKKQMKTIATSL